MACALLIYLAVVFYLSMRFFLQGNPPGWTLASLSGATYDGAAVFVPSVFVSGEKWPPERSSSNASFINTSYAPNKNLFITGSILRINKVCSYLYIFLHSFVSTGTIFAQYFVETYGLASKSNCRAASATSNKLPINSKLTYPCNFKPILSKSM